MWQIRRNNETFTAPDTATLQRWARDGNILPGDYVLNPTLNQWAYAKDTEEIRPLLVRSNPVGRPIQLGCLGLIAFFGGAAIWLLLGNGLLAVLVMGVGEVLLIIALVIGLRRRSLSINAARRGAPRDREGTSRGRSAH